MSLINRRHMLQTSLAAAGMAAANNVLAADALVAAPPGIKTFSRMPKSGLEVSRQHLAANNEGIEFLPKGEPLELSSFKSALTNREAREREREKAKGSPTIVATRKFVLSVGIEVAPSDQGNLPALSKATILDYLSNHYVSLQARIQKDSKGNMYLHHRPMVATSSFGKVKITEDFVEGVVIAVKNIHSLGMFVPAKTPPTPENLRTAVMVFKFDAMDNGKKEARYEFVIIRGKGNSLAGKLDLHCFVTSDERTRLHYLRPALAPLRYSDCSLRAQVQFTRFTGGDLIPADSITRSQTVTSRSSYTMNDLDAFVKNDLKLSGDALTNLNETLDAIIDGKVKSKAIVVPSKTATGTTSTNSATR